MPRYATNIKSVSIAAHQLSPGAEGDEVLTVTSGKLRFLGKLAPHLFPHRDQQLLVALLRVLGKGSDKRLTSA